MRKHLTVEQSYAIYAMLQTGVSQKAMAAAIGVDKSTISRELRRNCGLRRRLYVMDLAQRKAESRQKGKRRRSLFTGSVKEQAREMLERKLSPEQIAGRCKVGGIEMVSHETLYKWIWKDKRAGGGLHAHLPAGKGGNTAIEGWKKTARASFRGVWTYREERRLWREGNGWETWRQIQLPARTANEPS